MATGSSSRDVILTLAVESLGEEGIKQLQTAINALAKEGGLAGPEFKQLADQISRLGEQNTAVQTIKKLADETEQLKSSQTDAAQKTSELGQRLEVLQQASSQAAEKQREAKDAVLAAKQELAIYSGEISKLRAEYDAAGKKTEEYQTKFKALIDKQTEGRTRLVELREEQKAATSEYDKAQSSVDRLAKEYDKSVQSVDKLTKAANDNSAALNAASEQAQKLGVATENITASEAELIDIFNRGVTAIEARKVAIAEMAESDRLLAIQEQRQIALLKQGEQALQAEVLALRDAERSNQEYAAAKAKATADEEAWQREAFAIVEAKEAAQKLAKETEVLVAAEQELAKQNAFEKLATEAQRLSQAAEYVRFWETELAKAEQQVKETAAAASQASAKIESAFKTVGVRSVQDLKEEIAKTKAAMETLASESAATGVTLKGAFDAGNAKINALERDLRELNGTMTLGDKTAKLFAGSMSQIAAGNVVADAIGYLAQKVKDLTVEFFTVNLEAQRLSKALSQVYGDSGAAAQQFAFLRATADRSGLSIRDLSDGFIRFSAAANASGISLQNANALFAAVTNAAGQLGLRGEQVTGTLEALGQMASKGVVSMEELRQQLGDRLPGAMSIAAKGLGVTQDELVKMVESGSLATKVFFPAFEKGLNETFGSGEKKVEGFTQGWNRLVNAITKAAQAASDTSFFTKLGQAFDFVAERIGFVVKAVELLVARFAILKVVELTASFLGLGNSAAKAATDITAKAAAVEKDTVATVANSVATAENTASTDLNTAAKHRNAQAWGAIAVELNRTTPAVQKGTAAINESSKAATAATVAKGALGGAMGLLGAASSRLVGFLGGPIGALITLALYGKEAATVIGETAAKMFGWGKVLDDTEKKIAALAETERKAAERRRIATNEQDIASAKAAANSAQAVKLAEKAVEAAGAEVKAIQQKYTATQDLVKLQGEDRAGLEALAAASLEVVKSAEKDLASKEALANATKVQIAAIRGVTNENNQLTPTQLQQIKTLEEIAEKRQSEANEQRETIRQLTIEATSRKVASASIKDNSGRVKELSQSYEDAKSKLEIMRDSGVMSLGQLQKAEIEVAAASKLRTDAIKDVIRNTEVEFKQASVAATAKNAESDARIKHLETLKDEASRLGLVSEVTKLDNAIRSENIKVLERRRDLVEKEIQADLEIIAAKRSLLTADTDENTAQLKLLDAEEQLVLSRRKSIKSIDDQVSALKKAETAVDDLTSAYHQLGIKTPEELAQIADKNEKAWQKIKEDGRASVEQLKTAFEKYAQSVIDAAGDMGREMAESMLKGEAATRNLNVTIDQTGKVTVDAMGKASNAINNARGYMTAFERSALAATVALEAQNAEIERRISAQEKANELLERELELERKRLGVDKEGFRVDKDGNRIQIVTENKRTVYDKAKASGLTDAQALGIADRFINQYGYQIGSEQTGKPWSVAVQEAINDQVIKNARDSANQQQQQQQQQQRGGADTDTTRQQPRSTPRNDKTTVTINLANGASKRINTDPAGATALQEVLQSLETSSRTTL